MTSYRLSPENEIKMRKLSQEFGRSVSELVNCIIDAVGEVRIDETIAIRFKQLPSAPTPPGPTPAIRKTKHRFMKM